MPVRIFLSAVSDEFRDYREQLRSDLTLHNTEVKIEEDFKNLGKSTLYNLDTYIKSCDAVIHLVGDMIGSLPYGDSPAFIEETYPALYRRLLEVQAEPGTLSYTQWEAWLAIHHRKPLFIARADRDAPRGPKYAATPESRAAQQAHLARLRGVERFPTCTFTNVDNLAKHIAYTGLLDLLAADASNTRPAALVEPLVDMMTMVFVDLMRLACVAGSDVARRHNGVRYPEFVDMADLHVDELKTHVSRMTGHTAPDVISNCLAVERHMSHVLVRLRRGPTLDRSWVEFSALLAKLASEILSLRRLPALRGAIDKVTDAISSIGPTVRGTAGAPTRSSPDEFFRTRLQVQSAVLREIKMTSGLAIATIRDDMDRRLAVPYFVIDAILLGAASGDDRSAAL